MPFELLGLLVWVGAIVVFFSWLITIADKLKKTFPLLITPVWLGLVAWAIVGGLQPPIVKSEFTTIPRLVEGVYGFQCQCICYEENGKLKIVNLNQLFDRQLMPNDVIVVTIYSKGPYCGIIYQESSKIEIQTKYLSEDKRKPAAC